MAITILVGCTPKADSRYTFAELLDNDIPNNLDISDPSVDRNISEDWVMICLVRRIARIYPNNKFSLKFRNAEEEGMSKDYCGWIIAMDFDFNYEQSEISKVMNCRFKDPDGGNLDWDDIK